MLLLHKYTAKSKVVNGFFDFLAVLYSRSDYFIAKNGIYMCDFGLGDNIINDKLLLKTLKWHNLLDSDKESVYTSMSSRAGNPMDTSKIVEIKDGGVSDLGDSPIKSGDESHK